MQTTIGQIGRAIGTIIILGIVWHTCCYNDRTPAPTNDTTSTITHKTTIGDTWSADEWDNWNEANN